MRSECAGSCRRSSWKLFVVVNFPLHRTPRAHPTHDHITTAAIIRFSPAQPSHALPRCCIHPPTHHPSIHPSVHHTPLDSPTHRLEGCPMISMRALLRGTRDASGSSLTKPRHPWQLSPAASRRQNPLAKRYQPQSSARPQRVCWMRGSLWGCAFGQKVDGMGAWLTAGHLSNDLPAKYLAHSRRATATTATGEKTQIREKTGSLCR